MKWWKFLSIVLLLYALVVGMLVPLRPGIHSAQPSSVRTGENLQLKITGYNTQYAKDGTVNLVWLKTDGDAFLKASSVSVEDDQNLTASFTIPDKLPDEDRIEDVTLLVHNTYDGTAVFPSAVFITRDSTLKNTATTWTDIRPDKLSQKEGFYFPYRNILVETIRNTFYHVSLWFAMFILLLISVIYAILYLFKREIRYDRRSKALISAGILFGLLGLATGSIWAKVTWGTFWTTDVKLNMAAVSMLIYIGYVILRQSISDREKKATTSAAYAIFAYFAMIPLLFIVPRLTDSLHPGNGGNPGLGGEDLDNTLRMVFYPAIVGFTLLGLWLSDLSYRIERIRDKYFDLE
ncbi:MAG: cytochrome c biogenesis protein CcsA [Saprospiraceae bacterium]|nr:cytochrome c biogenesis protein CcsA [Saprospiraceae bacterium]